MDLKETDILGPDIVSHWYYQSKAAAMARLIETQPPSLILDIGAGSGFFSQYLLEHTTAAGAWCVDISYKSDLDSIVSGKQIYYRRSIDTVDADLVLLMDVLEHVEDDIGLLQDYVQKVPRGARFLISVPAFHFLWSAHDEFLEHKRRYTLGQLEEVVRRAGLTPIVGTYYFGLIFPLVMITRLSEKLLHSRNQPVKSQLKKHSVPVNSTLSTVCKAELSLLPFNRLAGLTAFCVATRPKSACSSEQRERGGKYKC